MFTVTEKARVEVANHMKDRDPMPVRVFLHQGGCGGPSMAMALDEKKDTDTAFEFDGLTYIVDTAFLQEAQPIEVDYLETGFKINCSLELGGGCSSCGTQGSCCS